MRQAVLVSAARTPIVNAHRGAFDNTEGQEPAAHATGAAGLFEVVS
ncbi:hypothetical protein HW130_05815 [Streptomyces sp. PKU-EA00015]|nr:hypothetical protein [Streptomyces sp. PKU-EA00015]NWF25784.1 hypothetical protein [Streptomyces sp. PKU-EA00015]